MNILITGGTGFFGRNLSLYLKNNYKVFIPNHEELDILDYSLLEKYIIKNKIQIVLHCATATGTNYFEPTILMFRNILKISRFVEKIIYFGSGAEYGKKQNLSKVKEESWGKIIPDDPNGLSKYINSELAKKANNIITLRVFGAFGKHEDYLKKFISNSIVKNIYKIPIEIKQNALFDYLYIEDLCKIVMHFMHEDIFNLAINCTPDKSISLKEIVEMINDLGNNNQPYTINNSGMNYEYTGDNTLLHKYMPNLIFTPYERSIHDLYKWYLSKKNKINTDSLKEDIYYKTATIINYEKK